MFYIIKAGGEQSSAHKGPSSAKPTRHDELHPLRLAHRLRRRLRKEPAAPFATIARALISTRAFHKTEPSTPCTIHLLSGVHTVPAPLTLDANDSWTHFQGGDGVVVSGGLLIPPMAWRPSTTRQGVLVAELPDAAARALGTNELKVLHVDGELRIPARYPDVDHSVAFDPKSYLTLASSTFLGNNTFHVSVASSTLPSWAMRPGFAAHAHVWPIHSWISIHGVRLALLNATAGGRVFYELRCPDQCHCTNTSNNEAITPGVRFYLYGADDALSAAGEWTYDTGSRQLMLHAGSGDSGGASTTVEAPAAAVAATTAPVVRVPTSEVLFWLRGAPSSPLRNVSFAGIEFADTRFDAQGAQEGFNQADWPPAMPSDAAVRISDARGVRIVGCSFARLGGGGVHVGNRSRDVEVVGSRFDRPGQSGVVLTGNSSAQPRRVLVENCSFVRPGSILSSAAGILGSSASACTFRANRVFNSSRWGIALRSNGATASRQNLVELNLVEGAGQQTRDLGGISLIGAHVADVGTTIRSNCVRGMVGTDTNPAGILLRPFFTWSVYLDNNASGLTVEGNALRGNVNGGVFYHGGSDNVVRNNVLSATSGHAPGAAQPGDYGFYHAGSVDWQRFVDGAGNNSFVRNVVLSDANQSLWHVRTARTDPRPPLGDVERNLYFSSVQEIARMQTDRFGLAPFEWSGAPTGVNVSDGTWASWRAAGLGYDRGSVVDVEPGFRDAASGDFTLVDGAAAARLLGFEPIDSRILPC